MNVQDTWTKGRAARPVVLGLRENWRQFSLLVVVNAFVGAMVGLERTVIPVLASASFGLASASAVLSFIATFGLAKAFTNLAAGWLITGRLAGALTALLWGGLVRIFLLHHVTWSINSICHFFGRRRFEVEDRSTNVWWLALPSFGEAWHHNHHTFPRSARHGLSKLETSLDPSAWLIAVMERLGLVWDVVRITPERQRQKLAAEA